MFWCVRQKERKTHLAMQVLFVVHGQGTGRTRAAVQERLRNHWAVKSFKEDPNSAGGCTVVELKY